VFALFPDEMFADLFTDVGRRSVWTTPVILEAVGSGKDLRHGSGSEVPG
jgi:hypothetical protein